MNLSMTSRCSYDYLCIIDFEATCIDSEKRDFFPHEIIEFPSFLIDVQKQKIVSSFHSFVKPVLNPELSEFCKNLTGISQDQVDEADTFDVVFHKFLSWIDSFLTSGQKFIVLSDGPWDMSRFLTIQCHISNISFPMWGQQFINVKSTFKYYNRIDKVRLTDMLQSYGLRFTGRLHSGKDDSYNIAQLVLAMLKHGCEFLPNGKVSSTNSKYIQNRLFAYLREQRKHIKSKKKKLVKEQELPETGVMDIDPDIIGSEAVLLKHKSNP